MSDYSTIDHNGRQLAFVHSSVDDLPRTGVLFCGGFKSNMQGQKALALEEFCKHHRIPYTRFDYSGHGNSDGVFIDGDIGTWYRDAQYVFDQVSRKASEKVIIVGSSMGAWIATLLAQARPTDIAGVLTIAAAPDFTEKLLLPSLSEEQRQSLENGKTITLPSDYDDGSDYPFSSHLIKESRHYCVLNTAIDIHVPVRLLHGTKDKDVPYALSIELMEAIRSNDVKLTLIKGADHRLSSEDNLKTTMATLHSMLVGCAER